MKAPNQKYPAYMTKSPEGIKLLPIWHRVSKDCENDKVFSDYQKFFRWALENGFQIGARLRRFDTTKPYGAKNCEFYMPSAHEGEPDLAMKRQIDRWNRTVNVFRRYFGMEPFKEVPWEELYGTDGDPEETETAID